MFVGTTATEAAAARVTRPSITGWPTRSFPWGTLGQQIMAVQPPAPHALFAHEQHPPLISSFAEATEAP